MKPSSVPVSQEDKLSGMRVTSTKRSWWELQLWLPKPWGIECDPGDGAEQMGQNLGFKVTQLHR